MIVCMTAKRLRAITRFHLVASSKAHLTLEKDFLIIRRDLNVKLITEEIVTARNFSGDEERSIMTGS
uniref:AlNc14C345G10842 protein n=1 Tax=Albugo laibachii Nc14 TaxID=890382 RepID=F0WX87_9STRA|nr:AlNc14C345G10842 [Albugo laibachii Nc14]|eukprot:CCA26079.1 AlNc14C345G10842 [Albugo laibachii Nc14]